MLQAYTDFYNKFPEHKSSRCVAILNCGRGEDFCDKTGISSNVTLEPSLQRSLYSKKGKVVQMAFHSPFLYRKRLKPPKDSRQPQGSTVTSCHTTYKAITLLYERGSKSLQYENDALYNSAD